MTMPTTPGAEDGLECAYQGDDEQEEEDGDEEEETGEREEGGKDDEYVCLPNNGKTEEEEEEQVLCEGNLHVKFVNKPFFSDMKKFPVGFLYHSHYHS